MEHYSFFDAVDDGNGNYDREYNAQQFTDYFRSLVTTGVMKGAYNELEVTSNGANMVTSVKNGVAFVEGRYYYNDSNLELTHDTEVLGLKRIDRVVIRLDLNTENRYVRIFVKKGTPNNNPVAPTLTQTSTIYEISLAQVKIIGGQTYINSIDVVDERGKNDICPWAGSKILPNFNDDSLEQLVNDVSNLKTQKANKQQESWKIASLNTGWSSPSGQELKYFKDEFGFVHLFGKVRKEESVVGGVITTLPISYRPPFNLNILAMTSSGQWRMDIFSSGEILNSESTRGIYEITINIQYKVD